MSVNGILSFFSSCDGTFAVLTVDQSGAPNDSFRRNICFAGLSRLRYGDFIAVKTRDFFGETSPQTFVTRELINSYCFRRDKYVA